MGFKELLQSLRGNNERKEQFRDMQEQDRMVNKIEAMKKSSNERELELFQKEEREEQIKEALEYYRKKRQHEINFGHNPLNAKNITNHTNWEVMREPNLFRHKGNMFSGQKNIFAPENQVPAWRRR